MASNKERAKRIIVEILRQAGPAGLGTTKVYKAFWLAHLYYAQAARGYLSDWPVIRMPQGPGIARGDRLLKQLLDAGHLAMTPVQKGPAVENCYALTAVGDAAGQEALSPEANQAIQKAVEDVKSFGTASAISTWSHTESRSWQQAKNGDELDIYCDLIPLEDHEEQARLLAEMESVFEEIAE